MSNFPKEFDLNIYISSNRDLKNITHQEYIQHYNHYGKTEGRICSLIKNRYDFINLIDQTKKILEIGPLHSPCMDQTKPNIKNLDYFSKEELLENYKNDKNVNLSKINDVDYVIKGNTKYNEVINELFDICFSSHNIEHTPCFITFLNNVSSILKPGGLFFLCIPDYRYCFDRFRNESTIFDILDAFLEKRSRPNFVSLMESRYITTSNDSSQHWNRLLESRNNIFLQINDKDSFVKEKVNTIINDINNIIELYNTVKDTYIDSHCWKLSPNGFSTIIEILSKTQLIDFRINKIYPTLKGSNEFYVILEKN